MAQHIKFMQAAAGKDHNIAIDLNGQVWVWGDNSKGQLGLGDDIEFVHEPVLLDTFDYKIKQVTAGVCFSAALDVAGYVWTWGCNENGQLGDGTFIVT